MNNATDYGTILLDKELANAIKEVQVYTPLTELLGKSISELPTSYVEIWRGLPKLPYEFTTNEKGKILLSYNSWRKNSLVVDRAFTEFDTKTYCDKSWSIFMPHIQLQKITDPQLCKKGRDMYGIDILVVGAVGGGIERDVGRAQRLNAHLRGISGKECQKLSDPDFIRL